MTNLGKNKTDGFLKQSLETILYISFASLIIKENLQSRCPVSLLDPSHVCMDEDNVYPDINTSFKSVQSIM